MIIELASLPPVVQAYIQNKQQLQLTMQNGKVVLEPLATPTPKPREPGLLAHLVPAGTKIDESIWFEPMSEEELAWWNGDYTDEYGLSK